MDSVDVRKKFALLLGTALVAITPSKEDRAAALAYGEKFTAAVLEAYGADNPDAAAAAKKKAQGFLDAASLLVARYEVKTVVEGRKLASELLAAGGQLLLALLP